MGIYQEKIKGKITIRHRCNFTRPEKFRNMNSWHKNFEICRFIKGNFDITVNNKKYFVHPGDILVIKSGEIHCFEKADEENCLEICTFDPLILYNSVSDFSVLKTYIKYEELKETGIDKEIEDCFSNLVLEAEKENSSSKILAKANLLKIYGLLLRYFEKEDKAKGNLSNLIAIRNVIEYISDHYSEEVSLAVLSEKFNYSPQYISSAFATYAGVNFKYYLDNTRVSKAIEMLQETTLSVGEIATKCGFDNIRTFNNVFKKVVGYTPSSVRTN